MSAILMIIKIGVNCMGFLSTYFSIGDHKIYPVGILIGSALIFMSILIPEKGIQKIKKISVRNAYNAC